MTATVYLIRHGETTWNRAGRLQGQADAPLTLHGTRQIRAIGAALRQVLTHEGVDAGNGGLVMHASTLGRARQSAAIVAELIGHDYDAIRFDPRLVDPTVEAAANPSLGAAQVALLREVNREVQRLGERGSGLDAAQRHQVVKRGYAEGVLAAQGGRPARAPAELADVLGPPARRWLDEALVAE